MKLTTFLLIISLMQVSAATFGQKMTLKGSSVSADKLFFEIRKQTGYDVLIDNSAINRSKRFKVDFKDAGLDQVLNQVIRETELRYSIEDKTIVISKKPGPSFLERIVSAFVDITVRGVVVDENGQGLAGATVKVKGTNKAIRTNDNGAFTLTGVDDKAVIEINFLGYKVKEINAAKDLGNIQLEIAIGDLSQVEVVSTGYQKIAKERMTGSYVQLDSALVNRTVSTNVVSRLKNMVPGLLFFSKRDFDLNSVSLLPSNNKLEMTIRGQCTLSPDNVGLDPLIVLDNFPYEGDIRNINPNDIESISVLKDAAAASIWGARAGNGVIVITTKKGALNKKMSIEVNANVTVGQNPDIYYDPNYLTSASYIGVETYLFKQGFFNSDITNTTTRPPLSPVAEMLQKRKLGQISSADSVAFINDLNSIDVRDDYKKFVYQQSVNQQYSVGLRGGGEKYSYSFSAGSDKNKQNLVRNSYDRLTIASVNTYKPINRLEITAGINYSQNSTYTNNGQAFGNLSLGGKYGAVFPYARFADENGNPLSVIRNYRQNYVDSVSKIGFLDWHFKPLDDIANADSRTKQINILARLGAKYRIIPSLDVEVQYQNEKQTIEGRDNNNLQMFSTRDLVNRFSVRRPDGTFNYQVPLGGVMDVQSYNWNMDNFRTQFSFDKQLSPLHHLSSIAGIEIRQRKAEGYLTRFYGYDDEFGVTSGNINYSTSLPTNPSGNATISNPVSRINGILNRYISYFVNASYTYSNRYVLYGSARKDGANLFGVKTNDKIVPLWSAGFGWNLSNESFYHFDAISFIKLRGSIGFNGNVYSGGAYSVGSYSSDPLTGAQAIGPISAPNPELSWERIRNINLGLDFSLKNNVLSGTIDFFRKDGVNLVQSQELPGSTGFGSYLKNSATTRGYGTDVSLTSKNIDRELKWNTTLLLSTLRDKVVDYNIRQAFANIVSVNGALVLNRPLNGIFALKWAGLDPVNGDPQGYLKGKVSKDYAGMITNFNPDSLSYMGVARPAVFGAFRNDLSFKNFALSFNIAYKLGYVQRRGSTSLNYSDILTGRSNIDFERRWQKPGDELNTDVPSLVYPSNSNRNNFYTFSEALVYDAAHIRLADIRLSYELAKNTWKAIPFQNVQVYAYANNLGILWRANKLGLDPDVAAAGNNSHTLPLPFQLSLGLKISL